MNQNIATEPITEVIGAEAAERIVREDLAFIARQAADELSALSGRRVVIAGGAGFLGYYLVQGPLHWNRMHPEARPISVTVLDSFVRGVPSWLTALEGDPNLRLVRHDITNPLPADLGDVEYFVHAASI